MRPGIPKGLAPDYDGIFCGADKCGKEVETNKGLVLCKICKCKLSRYNLNEYCFKHQKQGQRLEDAKEDRYKSMLRKRHLRTLRDKKNHAKRHRN